MAVKAPVVPPGKSWVFALASAEAETPEFKAELLKRLLTSDEDRLLVLNLLKEHFGTACHSRFVSDDLEESIASVEENISQRTENQAAMNRLQAAGCKEGERCDYFGDEVTVLGFHPEEGCVIARFADGIEKHLPANDIYYPAEEEIKTDD